MYALSCMNYSCTSLSEALKFPHLESKCIFQMVLVNEKTCGCYSTYYIEYYYLILIVISYNT